MLSIPLFPGFGLQLVNHYIAITYFWFCVTVQPPLYCNRLLLNLISSTLYSPTWYWPKLPYWEITHNWPMRIMFGFLITLCSHVCTLYIICFFQKCHKGIDYRFLRYIWNQDLTEIMQQLWRITVGCSSFILTLYFKPWRTLLYQQYIVIVKMFA